MSIEFLEFQKISHPPNDDGSRNVIGLDGQIICRLYPDEIPLEAMIYGDWVLLVEKEGRVIKSAKLTKLRP